MPNLLSDQVGCGHAALRAAGPYAQLYRRIAHWLMKEPALEEEALTATADGTTLQITRQTMSETPEEAIVRFPSGKTSDRFSERR